jgi:hypothetical protein
VSIVSREAERDRKEKRLTVGLNGEWVLEDLLEDERSFLFGSGLNLLLDEARSVLVA